LQKKVETGLYDHVFAMKFQIGLYDHMEAALKLFWDSCSAGVLGERLYEDMLLQKNSKNALASVQKGHTASQILHLSQVARCRQFTLPFHAFFMAREATGALEDAWPKPRRRLKQPLRPDLSLNIQNYMMLQPHYLSHYQLPLSGGGVGTIFFRQEHNLQPCESHTRSFAQDDWYVPHHVQCRLD